MDDDIIEKNDLTASATDDAWVRWFGEATFTCHRTPLRQRKRSEKRRAHPLAPRKITFKAIPAIITDKSATDQIIEIPGGIHVSGIDWTHAIQIDDRQGFWPARSERRHIVVTQPSSLWHEAYWKPVGYRFVLCESHADAEAWIAGSKAAVADFAAQFKIAMKDASPLRRIPIIQWTDEEKAAWDKGLEP